MNIFGGDEIGVEIVWLRVWAIFCEGARGGEIDGGGFGGEVDEGDVVAGREEEGEGYEGEGWNDVFGVGCHGCTCLLWGDEREYSRSKKG